MKVTSDGMRNVELNIKLEQRNTKMQERSDLKICDENCVEKYNWLSSDIERLESDIKKLSNGKTFTA